MTDLYIVDNLEQFGSLREAWNELLEHSDSNNIFLRWEWLYNWWKVYGNGKSRLFIIVIKDGNRLLGIAPLYIKKGYSSLVNEVRFLGSNIVCSDYLDFILFKNREHELLCLIVSYFKKNSSLWDVLKLTDIYSEAKNLPLIELLFQGNKMRVNMEYKVCPYINLSTTWDSIYGSYTSTLRNTIERKIKKLKSMPNAGFVEVGPHEDLSVYFSKFLYLNKLRLKKKGIRSPFLDMNYLTFHKNVIYDLYKKKMAKLYFLKTNNELIAGIYFLYYGNKYYYYQSGFDPAWEKLSPGTLLFHYCIKTAYERGIKEFDFLQGNESYKNNWTKTKRTNVSINIYSNTMKGHWLSFIDGKSNALKKFIKYFLNKNWPTREKY